MALEAGAQAVDGPFGNHLHRMWLGLSQSADLVDAVRGLLRGKAALTQESFFRLRSAGIIVGTEPGAASLRCGLYASYLKSQLK
jgi:hypothetical protein